MKNKKLLFLSLFLLLTTATQCMKREISESSLAQLNPSKPQIIQEIKNNRNNIIQQSANCIRIMNPADSLLFQENWCLLDKEILNLYKTVPLSITKNNVFDVAGYSYLALAVISVKDRQNTEPVPFAKKKELVQKFLDCDIIPTPKDKEFAFLEKWERCEPIIHKICFFHYACSVSKMLSKLLIPQEIINYISLLMFNTEESLL